MSKALPNFNPQTIALTPRPIRANSQFPSIFRSIPESPTLSITISAIKIIMLCSLSIYLLYATLKQGQLLQANQAYYQKVTLQRQKVEKELTYWKKIVEKYNNYPDAYLKIASLEYSLGNMQASKNFTQKALGMNPDIQTGKVLGEQMSR